MNFLAINPLTSANQLHAWCDSVQPLSCAVTDSVFSSVSQAGKRPPAGLVHSQKNLPFPSSLLSASDIFTLSAYKRRLNPVPALEAQTGRQALSTDDQPSRALHKTRGFQLPTLLWGLGRTPGRARSGEGGVKHP